MGSLEQSILREERLKHEPHISPTFDDGPHPMWTPRILSELRRSDAKATFFVVAPLAARFSEIVRRMVDEGHEAAFHCSRHIRHTGLTRAEVERDTEEGLRSLEGIGVSPRLWRPPWGVLAPWTSEVADDFGLEISLWDADTHDWRGDSAEEMLEEVGPSLSSGDIVLMHDGLGPGATRSGCEETVRLVSPLASRIREVGCEPSSLAANALRGAKGSSRGIERLPTEISEGGSPRFSGGAGIRPASPGFVCAPAMFGPVAKKRSGGASLREPRGFRAAPAWHGIRL